MKAKKCRRVKYSATKGDFSRVLRPASYSQYLKDKK